MLYRQEYNVQIAVENRGLAGRELSKIMGERWRKADQEPWKLLAEEKKVRHQQQYPDYRDPGRYRSKCPECGGFYKLVRPYNRRPKGSTPTTTGTNEGQPPPPRHPQSPPTPQASASPRLRRLSSISDLLSDAGRSETTSEAATRTPTLPTEPEHEIKQAFAARSCGLDERPAIDQPPIVQLTVDDPNMTAKMSVLVLKYEEPAKEGNVAPRPEFSWL